MNWLSSSRCWVKSTLGNRYPQISESACAMDKREGFKKIIEFHYIDWYFLLFLSNFPCFPLGSFNFTVRLTCIQKNKVIFILELENFLIEIIFHRILNRIYFKNINKYSYFVPLPLRFSVFLHLKQCPVFFYFIESIFYTVLSDCSLLNLNSSQFLPTSPVI